MITLITSLGTAKNQMFVRHWLGCNVLPADPAAQEFLTITTPHIYYSTLKLVARDCAQMEIQTEIQYYANNYCGLFPVLLFMQKLYLAQVESLDWSSPSSHIQSILKEGWIPKVPWWSGTYGRYNGRVCPALFPPCAMNILGIPEPIKSQKFTYHKKGCIKNMHTVQEAQKIL